MFEDFTDPLWLEFRSLETKQDNLRRGIFQRYSALMNLVESLQSELIEVRSELQKNKKADYSHLELFKKTTT